MSLLLRPDYTEKSNLRITVLVLALILSLVLAVSCQPMIESTNPTQDTAESAPAEDSPADDDEEDKYFNVPRAVTSSEDLHLTGNPPEEVDIEAYRLDIAGLVDNPLSLSYQDILAYPAVTEVVLLVCPGVFQDNAEWTGVPVWAVLQEAGINAGATEVVFKAMESSPPTSTSGPWAGGSPYRAVLPLEEIVESDSIFLAHTVNGQLLPLEHGYPIRLVAKDRVGSDWVKWLEVIEVR